MGTLPQARDREATFDHSRRDCRRWSSELVETSLGGITRVDRDIEVRCGCWFRVDVQLRFGVRFLLCGAGVGGVVDEGYSEESGEDAVTLARVEFSHRMVAPDELGSADEPYSSGIEFQGVTEEDVPGHIVENEVENGHLRAERIFVVSEVTSSPL